MVFFLFFYREPVGLSVFSDDETDLIRELQTMCSSKSEPDISKVVTSVLQLRCLDEAFVCKSQILCNMKVYQCLLLDQNLNSKGFFCIYIGP